MRLVGIGALALSLLGGGPTPAEELPVVVTRLGGPFLWAYDSLVSDGDGILFQTRGDPADFTKRPGAWVSRGTVASTRRLSVPGIPNNTLLGYRGDHVFLQSRGSIFGPPKDVVSLDRRTGRVTRLRPGYASKGTAADSGFFFVLDSGAEPGLYRSDGTLAGTRKIFSQLPYELVSLGRDVVFWSARPHGASGFGLYRAKTTGVELLGEFGELGYFPKVDAFGIPDYSSSLGGFGRFAAFWLGPELWVTDGTPDGTRTVHFAPIGPLTAGSCGGQLLFLTYPLQSSEVWATDGTVEGTRLLSSALVDMAYAPFGVADAGEACYFLTAGGDAHLWKTDLTPAGTLEVGPIDHHDFAPGGSVGARGRVFFPKYGELWTSDGTQTGTRKLAGGLPGAPTHMVRAGGRIFFATFFGLDTPLWVAELPPALGIEDAEGREKTGGGWVTFRVLLSRRSELEVTVGFETEAGTATAGEDFLTTAGTLRFAPGERSKLVRVPILRDAVAEGGETFRVRLVAPSGADVERGLATGTIRDFGPGVGPRR